MFTSRGIVHAITGEVLGPDLGKILLQYKSSVLAGNNLYSEIAPLSENSRLDSGWTIAISEPRKLSSTHRVHGVLSVSRITYRHPKTRIEKNRYRPSSNKCVVIDFVAWGVIVRESEFSQAIISLLELCSARGVKLRPTKGSLGSALLRASPNWVAGRGPAPRFISDQARDRLPGNMYALRKGYQAKVIPGAYYIDQISSHHTIASSIPLPHPQHLHSRSGKHRKVEKGICEPWIRSDNISILSNHIGILFCNVECDFIPDSLRHLYPRWALVKGTRNCHIWTPELRLLDRRVRIRWVSSGFTSTVADPVLLEYAQWALLQRSLTNHPIVKSALLPAYGVLATKGSGYVEHVLVHSRSPSPKSSPVTLPLIGNAHRTRIPTTYRPVTQNVVARGVIESETLTRSIEYARELENTGIHVSQIYADGLIAVCDQLPFIPDNWRVVRALSKVWSPSSNTFVSDEVVRAPGRSTAQRQVLEHTSRTLGSAA